jgi:hypothetical protein
MASFGTCILTSIPIDQQPDSDLSGKGQKWVFTFVLVCLESKLHSRVTYAVFVH